MSFGEPVQFGLENLHRGCFVSTSITFTVKINLGVRSQDRMTFSTAVSYWLFVGDSIKLHSVPLGDGFLAGYNRQRDHWSRPIPNSEDFVLILPLTGQHINVPLVMSSLPILRSTAKFCTGHLLSLSLKTRRQSWMIGLFESIQSNSCVLSSPRLRDA